MTAAWYCLANGEEHGPFTAQALMQLAKEAKIGPETQVKKGEHGSWMPASHVHGLFDAPPPMVQTVPSPPPPLPESARSEGAKMRYRILISVVIGLFVYGFGILTGVLVSRKYNDSANEMSGEAKELADTLRAFKEAGIDVENMFPFGSSEMPEPSEGMTWEELGEETEECPPEEPLPHMTSAEYLTFCKGNEAAMEGTWVEISGIVETVKKELLGYDLSFALPESEGDVVCGIGLHRRDELANLKPGDTCVVVGKGTFTHRSMFRNDDITVKLDDCRITEVTPDPERRKQFAQGVSGIPPDEGLTRVSVADYLRLCVANAAALKGEWIEVIGIVENVEEDVRLFDENRFNLRFAEVEQVGRVVCEFDESHRHSLAKLKPGDSCVIAGRTRYASNSFGMFICHLEACQIRE